MPIDEKITPIAQNDYVTTTEDENLLIDLLANDSDASGSLLDAEIEIIGSGAGDGSVTWDPDTRLVTYDPNNNYIGKDYFFYVVKGADGTYSNPALVNITIEEDYSLLDNNDYTHVYSAPEFMQDYRTFDPYYQDPMHPTGTKYEHFTFSSGPFNSDIFYETEPNSNPYEEGSIAIDQFDTMGGTRELNGIYFMMKVSYELDATVDDIQRFDPEDWTQVPSHTRTEPGDEENAYKQYIVWSDASFEIKPVQNPRSYRAPWEFEARDITMVEEPLGEMNFGRTDEFYSLSWGSTYPNADKYIGDGTYDFNFHVSTSTSTRYPVYSYTVRDNGTEEVIENVVREDDLWWQSIYNPETGRYDRVDSTDFNAKWNVEVTVTYIYTDGTGPAEPPEVELPQMIGHKNSYIHIPIQPTQPETWHTEPNTYEIQTAPANGEITDISYANLWYRPNENFSGEDYFVMTVEDRIGRTLKAPVTVTIADNEYAQTVIGDDTDNLLLGDHRDNFISGGAGDDYITDFNNYYSFDSNDTFEGGAGADTLDGGKRDDFASYEFSPTGVSVNLITGEASGGDAEGDVLISIEGLLGSAHDDSLTGDAGDNSIKGLAGNDTLDGQDGNNTLEGGEGDDLLKVQSSASNTRINHLYGGTDDDTLLGSIAWDYLYGGTGNDSLEGNGGIDFLFGDAGDDSLKGGAGDDSVDGGSGFDTAFYSGNMADYTLTQHSVFYNGSGVDGKDLIKDIELLQFADGVFYWNDTAWVEVTPLSGGTAPRYGGQDSEFWLGQSGENDTLFGYGGDDLLLGKAGADVIFGGTGNDTIEGGAGNDQLGGDMGDDYLLGKEGNDTLYGDAGDDTLQGDAGDDYIVGHQGDDSILGGTGKDQLHGREGDDTLLGGEDDDKLYGDSGSDTIGGDDLLRGEGGNDILDGKLGNDTLDGGAGDDNLTGGGGNDRFTFSNLTHSIDTARDHITDFTQSEDIIDLTALGFTGIQAGAASGPTLGYTHSGGKTIVEADGSDFAFELNGTITLDNGDFVFV